MSHTLTNWHVVPVYREGTFVEVYARELEVGDVVLHSDGWEHSREGVITEIHTVFLSKKECILLWTPSMSIVVDGVASTCYTKGLKAVPKFALPGMALFAKNFGN